MTAANLNANISIDEAQNIYSVVKKMLNMYVGHFSYSLIRLTRLYSTYKIVNQIL